MSTVEGIAKIRYQDTCEEAKKYFLRWQSELHSKTNESWLKFACAKLHSVNTLVKPNEVIGDEANLYFLMLVYSQRNWKNYKIDNGR